jgi:hypothetical protein
VATLAVQATLPASAGAVLGKAVAQAVLVADGYPVVYPTVLLAAVATLTSRVLTTHRAGLTEDTETPRPTGVAGHDRCMDRHRHGRPPARRAPRPDLQRMRFSGA